MLAIALYGPIVLYRMITLARNWPVGAVTVATGCLELLLLLAALWLCYRGRPASDS